MYVYIYIYIYIYIYVCVCVCITLCLSSSLTAIKEREREGEREIMNLCVSTLAIGQLSNHTFRKVAKASSLRIDLDCCALDNIFGETHIQAFLISMTSFG